MGQPGRRSELLRESLQQRGVAGVLAPAGSFSATGRSRLFCQALNTTPMPPSSQAFLSQLEVAKRLTHQGLTWPSHALRGQSRVFAEVGLRRGNVRVLAAHRWSGGLHVPRRGRPGWFLAIGHGHGSLEDASAARVILFIDTRKGMLLQELSRKSRCRGDAEPGPPRVNLPPVEKKVAGSRYSFR